MEANEFSNIIYDKDDKTGIVLVSINWNLWMKKPGLRSI